jgi:DNA-3-methyladenine glycosylase II
MDYKAHLANTDVKLKKLITQFEIAPLVQGRNPYLALTNSIMSQQLHVKVAKIISERFNALFPKNKPLPELVTALDIEEMRRIGLSYSKAQYVKNIAAFALANKFTLAHFNRMDNQQVIDYVTQIKGVGQWTAEMFLMFCLARPNVFSTGDYGIQMAMKDIYKLQHLEKKALLQKMQTIAQKWEPYQTYACLYLWRYKDAE